MLKLVTGLPGAGKTSNELWDFLHNKDYANRPKYCTPIKGFNAVDHGVIEIEHIKGWRELPDGAVLICDEVQRFCGTDLGREAPDWVQDFAVHRHSGKDFILITQSPMFIHPFARKLANPHVNYHRPFNMKAVRYSWEGVQNDPTSKAAKNLGLSQMVKTDPKVFTLYTSTVLDTHKAKPPYKILVIFALFLMLAIAGGWYAFNRVVHIKDPVIDPGAEQVQAVVRASAEPTPFESPALPAGETKPVWTEETIKPRLAGNLYTAPVYDNLTAPTDFPRVGACMASESRGSCNCYTQQGTPIDVPKSACLVFVKNGAFDPWFTGRNSQQLQASNTDPIAARTENLPRESAAPGARFTVVSDNSGVPRKTGIVK